VLHVILTDRLFDRNVKIQTYGSRLWCSDYCTISYHAIPEPITLTQPLHLSTPACSHVLCSVSKKSREGGMSRCSCRTARNRGLIDCGRHLSVPFLSVRYISSALEVRNTELFSDFIDQFLKIKGRYSEIQGPFDSDNTVPSVFKDLKRKSRTRMKLDSIEQKLGIQQVLYSVLEINEMNGLFSSAR